MKTLQELIKEKTGNDICAKFFDQETLLTAAQQANQEYQSDKDEIMSLVDRYDTYINNDPDVMLQIVAVCEEFRARFPEYGSFQDMYPDMVYIPRDEQVTLGDLLINCSIQRIPDPNWIVDILGKFDPAYVNVVRIYPIQDEIIEDGAYTFVTQMWSNAYAIWDGQHTALTLLCLAMYAFDMTVEDALSLVIPVAIHPAQDIAKLRKRFIGVHDNTMTKPLDKFDLFQQYVFSVRNNGDTDPWSVRFEEIQTALEKFGCFFTHEKFGNETQAGAVSRPTEIFPTNSRDINKWKSSVLANVFEYHSLTNSSDCIYPLEIDNMAHIFRACDQQLIEVDTDYIRQFAKCLAKVTQNTWQKGYGTNWRFTKHKKVSAAYTSWYKRQSAEVQAVYKTRCNQTEVGPTWICQAVANQGFPYELPEFTGKFAYKFTAKELS